MKRPSHVDSYYAATAAATPDYPQLAGEVRCDACVVGAGLTGISTALHLAERGYDVVVLEAARVGWGASGRSGGQISPGFGCSMDLLQAQVGEKNARRLWDLSLEGVALVRERIARHAIRCDLKPGVLSVAVKPRHLAELRAWQRELKECYGYRGIEFLDRDALRGVLASERYCGGLYDPDAAHLHPLNYTLGLAQAAEQAGVRFFEGSPAQRVDTLVHTPEGRVRCRYLALCGNAYLAGLEPRLAATVMPVGTYIIATEPLGEARARALIANDAAVYDLNFVLDYFRLSADHRLLFGGRASYANRTFRSIAAAMRPRLRRVFPQLAGVAIDYAWGGSVAITLDRAPHLGRLEKTVYFAQGYSGHGMALAGLAGRLMAEAIAGNPERFEVFARIPQRPFPGGARLRLPALVLGTLYYRLRDML